MKKVKDMFSFLRLRKRSSGNESEGLSNKLTIKRQFQLGFIALMLLMLLIGVSVLYNSSQMEKNVEYLNAKLIPAVQVTESISYDLAKRVQRIYGEEADFTFTDRQGETDEKFFNDIEERIRDLKGYINEEKTLRSLNMMEDYNNTFRILTEEYKSSSSEMMRRLTIGDLQDLENNITTVNGILKDYSWDKLNQSTTEVVQMARDNKTKVIIINIIGLLFSFVLGFTINRLLNRISDQVKDKTYQASNKAQEVNKSAEDMKVIADQVEEKITKSYEVIENLTDGNQDIVKAAEEVSTSIEEIANGVADLSQQATSISNAGENTYQSIKNINQKIKSGTKVVYQTADTMKELQESVGKINKISDKIMKITDQTNLLALNAAIEAA